MRNLTHNNQRATRDTDLDFIHYPLDDESIRLFVEKLNCLPDLLINIERE